MYPDERFLTDEERQKLCEMIYRAFLEIRILGWNGKAEQSSDLADAFHNVPNMMWSDDFSIIFFRNFLESYQQKYSDSEGLNFLKMFDSLFTEKVDT